jgi:hypothetical protein
MIVAAIGWMFSAYGSDDAARIVVAAIVATMGAAGEFLARKRR